MLTWPSSLVSLILLIAIYLISHQSYRFHTKKNKSSLAEEITFKYTPTFIFEPICSIKECSKEPLWNIALFVSSPSANFHKRNKIRRTWGSIKYLNGSGLRSIFVIKPTADKVVQEELDKEQATHNDVLYVHDWEKHLTAHLDKQAALKWAAKQLTGDWFFASTHDDVVIDIFKLQESIAVYRELYTKNDLQEFPLICLELHQTLQNEVEHNLRRHWFEDCEQGVFGTSVENVRRLSALSLANKPPLTSYHQVSTRMKQLLVIEKDQPLKATVAMRLINDKSYLLLVIKEKMIRSDWYNMWFKIKDQEVCICK